jgi:hypothetical protein
MIRSILKKYQMGMVTDDHLVVESLHMVDPENPGLVLNSLPDSIFPHILRFATDYLRGRMITNYGVLPTQDQVLAAKEWIEELLQQKADNKGGISR